ncbi:MAG: E3 ubiquitin ligase family protein [Candidatus Micrarchaeota archaeon]|nr:E3 ubiquitin ligase family protein [Candidatus Micrarchaeota archaeon]
MGITRATGEAIINAVAGVCSIIFALFFLAILILVVTTVFKVYTIYRKIKILPTSKARSAALGLVEIKGQAKAVEPLLSPITKEPCIYYRLQCRAALPFGKRSTLVYHDEQWRDFYVEDDTGKVLVRSNGCLFDPMVVLNKYKGARKELPPIVEKFLGENPEVNKKFAKFPLDIFTIQETMIKEGDVYVIGTLSPADGKTGSTQEGLEIVKGKEDVLYVSDSDEKRVLKSIREKIISMVVLTIICIGAILFIVLPTFMVIK